MPPSTTEELQPRTIEVLLRDDRTPITADAASPVERGQAKDFQGVYQVADNWCWAAAAASVANYHGRRTNSGARVRQCDIVSEVKIFGTQACNHATNGATRHCDSTEQPDRLNPSSGRCFNPDYDRQYFLNRALRHLEMLERTIPINSVRTHCVMLEKPPPGGTEPLLLEPGTLGPGLDFDEIKELLDAGRLVCLRTEKNGARHFIIIYGCEIYPDTDFLIWDPDSGAEVIEADRLEHEYGPITHKIVTCRPGAPKC